MISIIYYYEWNKIVKMLSKYFNYFERATSF